jgi:FkbH-like protein
MKMKELSYSQLQEFLNQTDLSNMPLLRMTILRNIVCEPIESYLRYFGYEIGFNVEVRFGEYDNIFQEAVGGNDRLFDKDTDCVLVFMKLESVSWDLARNFTGFNPERIKDEVERIQDYMMKVLAGIRRQTDAMILWHGFEFSINPSFGIWDSQIENGQMAVIRQLNESLRRMLHESANAYFVDLSLCLARMGALNFYDLRYWHIAQAPFTREALREIALEDFKFIRALKGKNKKCLVLDCDNILWGGIIGEDGLPGIKLGKSYPGSSYYEFQQEIVNFYNRGIIIALCSKNNEQDVWEVFQKHPDMVLKKEHISTAQINWDDKATNLSRIAQALNISLDSIVYMDDSEFEINLISRILPEVEVIHLPQDRAVEHRGVLASCGWFDTLTISSEDKKRGAMYKAEENRKKLMVQAKNLDDYYVSLEMEAEIRFADEFLIPRVAQLTQKTNQFNLTTRRYNETDIKHFVEAADSDVICLRLTDKFGDSGMVGICILKYKEGKAIFDTFLLSCRVLGRGAEDVFMVQALKLAKKRGCRLAIGEYYSTRKNEQVKDFYAGQGFKEADTVDPKADRVFHFDLGIKIKSEPSYFKKIRSEI